MVTLISNMDSIITAKTGPKKHLEAKGSSKSASSEGADSSVSETADSEGTGSETAQEHMQVSR